MGEIDTFGEYVRQRLDHWGDEFSLARDVEYLGYSSKNILKILMEHKGMPGRAQGFKPIETDALAHQIEDIVADLARVNRPAATVLRAYYGGRGRRNVERYETALMLLTVMGDKTVSLRHYHTLRKLGDDFVRSSLFDLARAA